MITVNSKRYSEKRPTQLNKKSLVNEPFDPNKFNFNKIDSNEVTKNLNINKKKRQNMFINFFFLDFIEIKF